MTGFSRARLEREPRIETENAGNARGRVGALRESAAREIIRIRRSPAFASLRIIVQGV